MSQGPFDSIEFQLGLLFRDLLNSNPASEVLEWSMALTHKLRVMRYFQERCLEVARQLPQIMKREEDRVVLTETTSALWTAEAYLECFFYFITSIFDILAKLTREFYPKNREAIGKKYFKQTLKFFTQTHQDLDPEFTAILLANKDWILAVYNNRDTLAHSASPFIAFEDDGQPSFEKRKPNDVALLRDKKFEKLPEYLRVAVDNIYDFLEAYLKHFRKVVPESDRTRMLLSSSAKSFG